MGKDKRTNVNQQKFPGMTKASRRFLAAMVSVAVLLSGGLLGPVPVRAQGATYTWKGGGGNRYWHTPENWEIAPGQGATKPPGTGDTAVLSATAVVECTESVTGVTLECEGKLKVSDGTTLSLAGDSKFKGDGCRLDGNGTIEITGLGSKLTWSGVGNIGLPENTGKMVVGEGAELLIEKAGQAILHLAVENNGHVTITNAVTGTFMYKGYTQTGTGTLTFDIGKDGDNAVFGPMTIVQEQALNLDGVLHVNLVDEYYPENGKTLELIKYPSSVTQTGTFAEITSSVPSRSYWVQYKGTDITLITEVVVTGAPRASLESDTYGGGAVNVTLLSDTSGATIYYTTDGSEPTRDSNLYNGPITVTSDTTIKTFAVKEGLDDSAVQTFTYVIKNDFSGGDGTENNPYLVGTVEELDKVRDYPFSCFKQTANIDLDVEPYNTNVGWSPIGEYDYVEEEYYPFCGIFDGQEYTISNPFINQVPESEEDPAGKDIGLFGCIDEAEIRNVKLVDVDVTGDSCVGGLVGSMYGGLVEGCSVTNSRAEFKVKGNQHVGGLVGSNEGGAIKSSYSESDVTGTDYCIGGLIGSSWGYYVSCEITDCYATGAVAGLREVGGLAGFSGNDITDSYATGTVEGQETVGGLVGCSRRKIAGSYSTGAVTGSINVGGLVGNNFGDSGPFIEDSYATGAVIGQMYVGGLVGHSGEYGSIKTSFAIGTVTGDSSIGGLAGRNQGEVAFAYARGAVTGDQCAGGLVGSNQNGYTVATITECYSAGAVAAKTGEATDLGGLIGKVISGDVQRCFWDTEASGQNNSTGGTGKSTAEMKQQGTYVGWDFADIWGIDAGKNHSYPFLRGVTAEGPEADPTPDQAIEQDLVALTWDAIRGENTLRSSVKTGLNLVGSGAQCTTITWSVLPDDGWINTSTGSVTRPASSQGNVEVTLTATVSKEGGQSRTKEFDLTIIASPAGGSSSGSATTCYTISATAGVGGTISPKTASVAAYGSKTFTITPDSGYQIEDVLVDGKSIGVSTSYTFERVIKEHTISVTFKKIDEPVTESPFKDVEETDWFYESVKYVYENGLMAGTGTDYFSPFLNTSRAMIVTVLHRLEKTPASRGDNFSDVESGTWYTDSVAWAAANGIVRGYGGNLFGPNDSITREQMVCILYNYAKYASYDVSQSDALAGFVDGGEVSPWALEAMQWAVGSGLIGGKGNGILDPTGPATRAEVAVILQRFIQRNVE